MSDVSKYAIIWINEATHRFISNYSIVAVRKSDVNSQTPSPTDQLYEEIQMLHDRICRAIGDPKRLMIIYALSKGPRYVSELAVDLGYPQPTVSRHLNALYQSGLVVKDRQNQSVYYSLRDERIVQALDLMRTMMGDLLQQDARVTISSTSPGASDEV